MMAFAERELLTENWMRALSLQDPAAPDSEEVNHGLAALSVAWRMCAREASVLLHEAAARCYLAARDLSTTNTTNKPQSEEEN